jgi:uncharacterized protein (TIGR02118 family)
MYRMQVLYPPPKDPEHFKRYYVEMHLPLVAKLPGLRASRYSFDIAGMGAASPYFCSFEAEFDDAAALMAAMRTPEGKAVGADVPNYASGGAVILHYPIG